MDYKVINAADRDDYFEITRDLINRSWPEFMMHDDYIDRYWGRLFEKYPQYQFALLENTTDRVIALGNSFPLRYTEQLENLPEKGLDWALEKAINDLDYDTKLDTQCAFQIVIDKEFRGRALSTDIVGIMLSIGRKEHMSCLIAPVRPNLKSIYPLTEIDRYVEWKDRHGLLFDPWLRVHERLGAKLVKVCHQSMDISGSVSEWEEWTGLKFFDNGKYVVPGALVTLEIDIANGIGKYIEPNVWMVHKI